MAYIKIGTHKFNKPLGIIWNGKCFVDKAIKKDVDQMDLSQTATLSVLLLDRTGTVQSIALPPSQITKARFQRYKLEDQEGRSDLLKQVGVDPAYLTDDQIEQYKEEWHVSTNKAIMCEDINYMLSKYQIHE